MRLNWSSGFSGLRIALTRRGESFVGEAKSFWDFERETQRAAAEALPVGCPEYGASSGEASPNVRVPPSALRASVASRTGVEMQSLLEMKFVHKNAVVGARRAVRHPVNR